MRRTSRLAIVLWTIGLSIFIAATLRANPAGSSTAQAELEPHETRLLGTERWAPQKLWLQLSTEGGKLNLYLLDQSGLDRWEEEGKIKPALSFENVSQLSYRYAVPARGTYAVLIQNPTESTVTYSLELTFYDFESDILVIATSFFIAGLTVLVIYHVRQSLKKRRASNRLKENA